MTKDVFPVLANPVIPKDAVEMSDLGLFMDVGRGLIGSIPHVGYGVGSSYS